MPTYGITASGFVIKTMEVIRAELDASAKNLFGDSVDVSDESDLGQLNAIIAEREALVWELAEAAYNSNDPDSNTGQAQDAICAITGTTRLNPAPSTTTLLLTGDENTVVTIGSQASVTTTNELFNTLANATLVLATAWVGTTAYVVGDIRSDTGGAIWECRVAGTSAASPGPQVGSEDGNGEIVDGTVTWYYAGNGLSFATVLAESDNTGAIVAAKNAIVTIETPISGWSSVNNLAAVVEGNILESNAILRTRRESELNSTGKAPLDAIRAHIVKEVAGQTSVKVFENNTDTTDADGVPPHAIELLIEGGEDQDIRNELFAAVGGGIQTYGTASGTVEDSQGVDHTLKHSRPTTIDIDCDIVFEFDPALTTEAISEAAVLARLPIFAAAQSIGRDCVSSHIKADLFANVTGLLDVSAAEIILATGTPIAETTIVITNRQRFAFDAMTATGTSGTP